MGSVRIVAGDLKGRRLTVPDRPGLRPTSDRAREALFDILGQRLPGRRVLDAFAGTGALGFEAVSRGAALTVFVEADAAAVEALRRNAEVFGVAARCLIERADACQALARGRVRGPFDLVMADPPWSAGVGSAFLAALAGAGVLAPGGRVVLERGREDAPAPAPAGWELARTARYGRTCLDFYIGGETDRP